MANLFYVAAIVLVYCLIFRELLVELDNVL
jgi:hypothetical protein